MGSTHSVFRSDQDLAARLVLRDRGDGFGVDLEVLLDRVGVLRRAERHHAVAHADDELLVVQRKEVRHQQTVDGSDEAGLRVELHDSQLFLLVCAQHTHAAVFETRVQELLVQSQSRYPLLQLDERVLQEGGLAQQVLPLSQSCRSSRSSERRRC